MATKAQRVQAIADALVNSTASVAAITRVANAFILNRLMDPEAFNQSQKADMFLSTIRDLVLAEVKRAEGDFAAQQARVTAHADVTDDFQEAP